MSMHSNGKCRIRFNQQPSDKDKTDWCELYFEDITLELRMQCRMYICYDRSSQVPRPSCEVGWESEGPVPGECELGNLTSH